MKILLDYVFPVTAITPTPQASTAFLKQVCLVVKPAAMVTPGTIVACTTQTAINALCLNTQAENEAAQLLAAGMAKVYILPMDDLGLADALDSVNDFFTVLISSDFDDEDSDVYATGTVTISSYANLLTTTPDTITIGATAFTAQSGAATLGDATFRAATSNDATATSLAAQINGHATAGALVTAVANAAVVTITANDYGDEGEDIALAYTDNGAGNVGASVSGAYLTGGEEALDVGTFTGVVGRYRQSAGAAATIAAIENHVGFYSNVTNKAKNMCYAFGKLLSNALSWSNQQYITMPFDDGVNTLGDSESLFDDKVSFVIADDEFGKRLGLFAAGGKAIVAPYITKNLQIDLQSAALSFISGNQPNYTMTSATLLENKLQDVINGYIERKELDAGTIEIKLEEENFVASGYINIAEPKALWRVFSEIRQTL